jgi:tetratricopeptide (TPR) repeat protein
VAAAYVAGGERILRDALLDFELATATVAMILVRRHNTHATWGGTTVSRRRPALGLLALLIALVGCTTTNAPSTARLEESKEMATLQARAAYERGLDFLGEGRTGAALTALQDATRLDPSAALYANTMGVVLLQWFRQVNAALAWFARAVELDPSYGDAQLNFATALSEGGQWEPAVERYHLALRLPTLTVPHRAHQNLGVALYNLKRYREAEESLRFALDLEPQMVGTHYNLGLVLLAAGRTDDAKAAFRRERELGSESAFGRAASDRLNALGDGGG